MRRAEYVVAAVLLVGGCARGERPVALAVGAVQLEAVLPRGWEHIDNGGHHEFRRGDMRMTLTEDGIATPESLASALRATRALLVDGRVEEAIARLSNRSDPVLAARDYKESAAFWRDWNSAAYGPFRWDASALTRELDGLTMRALALSPLEGTALATWAVAQRLDTLRYQIQSIAPAAGADSTWWLAHTWSRVSHTDRRQLACATVAGRLVVLDSGMLIEPAAERTFAELLASLESNGAKRR